jgi:hypothetical protein
MEEALMNANASETEKIKTHYARIVVGGTAEKPCYSIEWYDPLEKEYNLGYSSYYIGNVFNWLSEYFEIVDKDTNVLTNADRIRGMSDEELAAFLECFGCCQHCSEHERLSDNRWFSDERCDEMCVNHCLEWLKQPSEVDK